MCTRRCCPAGVVPLPSRPPCWQATPKLGCPSSAWSKRYRGRLLREALGRDSAVPQDDAQATYCKRIEREDARIDWSQPAETIWNQVRAYRAWPQAFTTWDERLLKILRAWPVAGSGPPGTVTLQDGQPIVAAGRGSLRLDEVVLEGRRPQSGAEFARGYPRFNGATLRVA